MRWIPVQAQWGGKMMGFAQTGFESVGKNTRRGGEMLRQPMVLRGDANRGN